MLRVCDNYDILICTHPCLCNHYFGSYIRCPYRRIFQLRILCSLDIYHKGRIFCKRNRLRPIRVCIYMSCYCNWNQYSQHSDHICHRDQVSEFFVRVISNFVGWPWVLFYIFIFNIFQTKFYTSKNSPEWRFRDAILWMKKAARKKTNFERTWIWNEKFKIWKLRKKSSLRIKKAKTKNSF